MKCPACHTEIEDKEKCSYCGCYLHPVNFKIDFSQYEKSSESEPIIIPEICSSCGSDKISQAYLHAVSWVLSTDYGLVFETQKRGMLKLRVLLCKECLLLRNVYLYAFRVYGNFQYNRDPDKKQIVSGGEIFKALITQEKIHEGYLISENRNLRIPEYHELFLHDDIQFNSIWIKNNLIEDHQDKIPLIWKQAQEGIKNNLEQDSILESVIEIENYITKGKKITATWLIFTLIIFFITSVISFYTQYWQLTCVSLIFLLVSLGILSLYRKKRIPNQVKPVRKIGKILLDKYQHPYQPIYLLPNRLVVHNPIVAQKIIELNPEILHE